MTIDTSMVVNVGDRQRGEIQVGLSSPADRTELVADLMVGSVQLAEIHRQGGVTRIEIYARPDGSCWELDLDHLHRALDEAVRRLG